MSPPAPPNWDDEFDFEDIDDVAPKKKQVTTKKANNKYDDDDFFDDQDNKNAGSSMLPTINANKNSRASKELPNRRESAKRNPYAENMDLKGNISANFDEQIYEEEIAEQKPKNVGGSKNQISSKKNDIYDEVDDYYEDIEDIPQKKPSNKQIPQISSKAIGRSQQKVASEPQDQYGDEDFEDAYGDDFEEQVAQSPKKQPLVLRTQQPKKKSIVNPPSSSLNVKKQPPKPPSRNNNIQRREQTQAPKRNFTMNKPAVPRPTSRNSVKSVKSNRATSVNKSRINPKFSTNSSFIPNKYSKQISKAFPSANLNQMTQDKISKLNDRVRDMIKKFNQQLNNLINKNMLYLKSKKNQKTQTVQDKLRVYEQHKKNNETMIQYMEKQFDKLCGREGELREQQYQLMTEKKIQELKQQIKQTQKQITKLQVQVKSEGNKLTKKGEDKKLAQQLHHLKTTLIQAKKDEEKQEQKITKLEEQGYDLDSKISDVDYKINQLIDKAKEKGIQLQSREQIMKKYQQIKRKVEVSKNHRNKLQNLMKTKSDIISHEKQQMKINIKNCELEIKNLYESINHSQGESVKVVQKAKTNPKVSENIVGHLDQLLKSLEQAQQLQTFSVRSQGNKSSHSSRPLKNIATNNMQKSEPIHTEGNALSMKKETRQDSSKPNLHKKKNKSTELPSEEKKNEVYERVWNEEQEQKQKKQKERQQEQKKRQQQRRAQAEQQQKDKKKPFSLRKNRLTSDNKLPATQQQKQDQPKQTGLKLGLDEPPKQQKKQQSAPVITGPRMMKFRRNKNTNDENNLSVNKQQNNASKQKINTNTQQISSGLKIEPKKQQAVEEQKSDTIKPFVPKRFNLRNRKEQQQNSYVPSVEVKQEPRKEEPVQKQPQFKINLDDVDDPYAKKKNNSVEKPALNLGLNKENTNKEPENALKVGEDKSQEQIKPRFNLRLRDRKKTNEDAGGYMPTSNKVLDDKPSSNPYAPSNNEPSNTNNPYAPANKGTSNPYAPAQNSSNPYAPKKQQPINNPYNPYAANNADPPARKRQGPVKSKKLNLGGGGQKFNIYEQAQQAEGLNQFVDANPPPKQDYSYGNNQNNAPKEDVNLNDLLGLNNKKNDNTKDDLADLLGGGTANKDKKKTNKGGKSDFFGDMDF